LSERQLLGELGMLHLAEFDPERSVEVRQSRVPIFEEKRPLDDPSDEDANGSARLGSNNR